MKKRLLKKELNLIHKGLYKEYKKAIFANTLMEVNGYKRFNTRKKRIILNPNEIKSILCSSILEDFQWKSLTDITPTINWTRLHTELYNMNRKNYTFTRIELKRNFLNLPN